MKKTFIFLSAGFLLFLAGCQNNSTVIPQQTSEEKKPVISNNIQANTEERNFIANPASQNCIDNGGKLEIRTNKLGQYGVCLFEDNRQCEEWALLLGNCPVGGLKVTGYGNEAEIYCVITGGKVEGVGTETPMCKKIDGTLCTAQANLDSKCKNPNDQNPNVENAEVP